MAGGLLGFLSPALTVGTDAAAAQQGANYQVNQMKVSQALQAAMLQRQMEQMQMEMQLNAARTGYYQQMPQHWQAQEGAMNQRAAAEEQRAETEHQRLLNDANRGRTSLKQNAQGQWVPVDETTGLGPNNQPVVGPTPRGAADTLAALDRQRSLMAARSFVNGRAQKLMTPNWESGTPALAADAAYRQAWNEAETNYGLAPTDVPPQYRGAATGTSTLSGNPLTGSRSLPSSLPSVAGPPTAADSAQASAAAQRITASGGKLKMADALASPSLTPWAKALLQSGYGFNASASAAGGGDQEP